MVLEQLQQARWASLDVKGRCFSAHEHVTAAGGSAGRPGPGRICPCCSGLLHGVAANVCAWMSRVWLGLLQAYLDQASFSRLLLWLLGLSTVLLYASAFGLRS